MNLCCTYIFHRLLVCIARCTTKVNIAAAINAHVCNVPVPPCQREPIYYIKMRFVSRVPIGIWPPRAHPTIYYCANWLRGDLFVVFFSVCANIKPWRTRHTHTNNIICVGALLGHTLRDYTPWDLYYYQTKKNEEQCATRFLSHSSIFHEHTTGSAARSTQKVAMRPRPLSE